MGYFHLFKYIVIRCFEWRLLFISFICFLSKKSKKWADFQQHFLSFMFYRANRIGSLTRNLSAASSKSTSYSSKHLFCHSLKNRINTTTAICFNTSYLTHDLKPGFHPRKKLHNNVWYGKPFNTHGKEILNFVKTLQRRSITRNMNIPRVSFANICLFCLRLCL